VDPDAGAGQHADLDGRRLGGDPGGAARAQRALDGRRHRVQIERTAQGVDIKFHETARVDPERIVELVAAGNGVTFAPPATLRLQASGNRMELFGSIENVLREIA